MTTQQRSVLSDEMLDTFREAFNLFDTDGDGAISREELGTLMRKCNKDLHITEEQLADMLREYDTDQSGSIEFAEFCDMMAGHFKSDRQSKLEDLRAAFDAFDADGSGKICSKELREMMHRIGEALTEEQIEEMISAADTDGDGQINFEEFIRMFEDDLCK